MFHNSLIDWFINNVWKVFFVKEYSIVKIYDWYWLGQMNDEHVVMCYIKSLKIDDF